jgi:hypothetical protein
VARINVVLARTAVPALLLSATSFVPAAAHALRLRSGTLEADALAYAVNGDSGVLQVSLANGLSIALGAGRYEVPGFIVQRQVNHEVAEWEVAFGIGLLRSRGVPPASPIPARPGGTVPEVTP